MYTNVIRTHTTLETHSGDNVSAKYLPPIVGVSILIGIAIAVLTLYMRDRS